MNQAFVALVVALTGGGGLATIVVAIISGRFGRVTARETLEDKRDERFSADAREMLSGYRADIAALRAELANSERRAAERNEAQEERIERQALKIESLEEMVDTQRSINRISEDKIAELTRENHGLLAEVANLRTELERVRAELARLTGLAVKVEAETANGDD